MNIDKELKVARINIKIEFTKINTKNKCVFKEIEGLFEVISSKKRKIEQLKESVVVISEELVIHSQQLSTTNKEISDKEEDFNLKCLALEDLHSLRNDLENQINEVQLECENLEKY
ncbi:hypothetical protein TpMuguga_04g00840 [Theileria parva strain Muguga]|uniref:Uncharacterized protein n=1 Tax=Theileria parva TaxID=5875 RepID=Q4N1A6_THEPA|nr:uncharacterized protein TpMuguga_04g00840 [Theileria parva strain Muguga]EAN32194.1 hypothetical protein TpMuguga_04g00840 [Theileria parva strain Muguga]|eukprot:XP_764477.1 hypothetical protein [Theileria parva strain Muguga]